MLDVEVKQRPPSAFKVVDGEHVLFKCSLCNTELTDVWCTQPTDENTWLMKVKCPHCGDASFIQEIKSGAFHINPIHTDPKSGKVTQLDEQLDGTDRQGNPIIIWSTIKG